MPTRNVSFIIFPPIIILCLNAAGLSLIDSSFIALDATPVKANVSNNNPKSFKKDKFSKASPPKADKDCRLGVKTASNQHNEKKYEFYWGYKNHILVDCISGLPICEFTTGASTTNIAKRVLPAFSRRYSAIPTTSADSAVNSALNISTHNSHQLLYFPK